jgi:hypothetical protein
MSTLPDRSPGYGDLWTDMSWPESSRASQSRGIILGAVLRAFLIAVPLTVVVILGALMGLINAFYGPRSIITRAVIRRYKYYGPYFAKR